jgi:hypothetical protein
VFLYYPTLDRPTSQRVDAGREQLLSGAVRLDATSGTEWFVALLCPRPFDFDQVEAAVRPHTVTKGSWRRRGVPLLFGQCRQSAFFLSKEARPTPVGP